MSIPSLVKENIVDNKNVSDNTAELKKTYLKDLMELIESQLPEQSGALVVYFESGHFNTRYGVDDFSISSFNDSVLLGSHIVKQYKKSVKLAYGILVDDLSLACSADTGCTLPTSDATAQQNQELPNEIEALIKSSKLLKRDRYLVFSERTAKNRAIKTLKKKIKDGDEWLKIQSAEDSYEDIIISGEGCNDILLCKRIDHIYNIRCPGILGQHYADVLLALQQRYFEATNFLIIDWSEMCDKNKVEQGVISAKNIFNTNKQKNKSLNSAIHNVFFADDEGEFVQVTSSSLNTKVSEDIV